VTRNACCRHMSAGDAPGVPQGPGRRDFSAELAADAGSGPHRKRMPRRPGLNEREITRAGLVVTLNISQSWYHRPSPKWRRVMQQRSAGSYSPLSGAIECDRHFVADAERGPKSLACSDSCGACALPDGSD
jgi:hypothetical protein